MARKGQEVQTIAPGEVVGGVTPLAEQIAREVRDGLESRVKTLLNHKEVTNMGTRERQRVAQDLVLGLFAHPEVQARYVQFALDQPGKFGAQVVALSPKTLEVENTTLRERVIVVAAASEEDWQASISGLSSQGGGNLPWDVTIDETTSS